MLKSHEKFYSRNGKRLLLVAKDGNTRLLEIIIDIADYLAVPVIAEGVETELQMLALRDMGCDRVQGYYFSRPLPADKFEKFIEERSKLAIEVSERLTPSREIVPHNRTRHSKGVHDDA